MGQILQPRQRSSPQSGQTGPDQAAHRLAQPETHFPPEPFDLPGDIITQVKVVHMRST